MSVSHFELILGHSIRACSNFTDFYAAVQLYQQHLLKRLSFPTVYSCLLFPPSFCLLCHRLTVHSCLIPGLSILSDQSVHLFFWRHHRVLITVAFFFQYCLKSRRFMLPDLSFSLGTALAILGLLWFHINFRNICSGSVKNVIVILIDILLNL